MNKTNIGMKVFVLLAFAVVVSLSFLTLASAGGAPILRAIPEQSQWIANGVTQYKITIEGDSTTMSGQNTRGIQTSYILPDISGYSFNVVNVNTSPTNDFFAGFPTSPLIGGSMIWRGVTSGNGPINRQGTFVELYITVSQIGPNALATQTSLAFDQDEQITYFRRPISQGGNIAPSIESTPFTVKPAYHTPMASVRASVRCVDDEC